ncbi:MAG: GNAT family N-acetyltransferase [Roseburia sp.]
MNKEIQFEKDGYVLRHARWEDAGYYYEQGFRELEPEIARLTGSRTDFTRDEVVGFFQKCVAADDRHDFLLINPDGRIIGESVVNEIDWEMRSANFRICIFRAADCGWGIGSWAVERTRDFAFGQLKLHRLELDVFSFNPRAKRVYEKAGFKQEGVLRDAIKDGDSYADDILMAILEEEWNAMKKEMGIS